MTQTRTKIQRLTLAAFFVAIEVIMAFTPIGYLPIGPLSITTMHLPVILAGVLLGPSFGAGMGFVFGLTSFLRATFQPGITSFVFTPFVQIGNMQGNFYSLLIVFVPRIILGWFSGTLFNILKIKNTSLRIGIVAVVNTMLHSILVLGGIWVFFGEPYASALGITMQGLAAAFMATITSNSILETILAAIVVPVLYRALSPTVARMGVNTWTKQIHVS